MKIRKAFLIRRAPQPIGITRPPKPAPGQKVHLPDASRDHSRCSRQLPHLRHGARAAHRFSRGRKESGTRRHDSPLLGGGGPFDSSVRARHERSHSRTAFAATDADATLAWVQLVLATPVVLWAGWPFFVRAWQSIVNRSLNMFTLIGLGVASCLSVQCDCSDRCRESFRRRFAIITVTCRFTLKPRR